MIRVDSWKPDEADHLLKVDGSIIKFPFNDIYGEEFPEALSCFVIKKDSYISGFKNKIDDKTGEVKEYGAAHYINYILKYYDVDQRIPFSYFKLKYIIDDKERKLPSEKDFRKMLYRALFDKPTVDMIKKLVEDNWYIDIERKDVEFAPKMKYTNEHGKLLMCISIGIKLMIPIVMHYLNNKKTKNVKNILFKFYKPLFDIFGTDVDMYTKLRLTIVSQVEKNVYNNPLLWSQQEIRGNEPYSIIELFLNTHIIGEIVFRYNFQKSPVNFNFVTVENQLHYFLITKYEDTYIDVDVTRSGVEGLSGMDKLEMNTYKIDESIPIMSRLNTNHTIKKLMKRMRIKNIDEEVEYYRTHHSIDPLHVQLLNYYYANMFGGYRDLTMLSRTQYLQLLVLMKRQLQYHGFSYLPQFMTANIDKLNKRVIQNKKFLSKIEESSTYKNLIENKFPAIRDMEGKEKILIGLLSKLINSNFRIVDFDHPELYGDELEIRNLDTLSDEFLNFLSII